MSNFCALLLGVLLFAGSAFAQEFRQATGDYQLRYPRDHGAHPDYETEWWYVTGHLDGESGAKRGFELVFFRVGVKQPPELRSAWKMDSFYFAHFAVTDDRTRTFRQFKRRSRGSFGQAGASVDGLDVRIRDWKLVMRDGALELSAAESGVALALTLRPKKPLVFHGTNGLSKKGPGPGDASYYTSFTRLEGSGVVTLDGKRETITHASAWLDQEFTSSKLAQGTEGWDWFAIQLDNGEELMVYQLRTEAGAPSDFSSGTWIHKDGTTTALARAEFGIEVLSRWTSPRSGISYPAEWRITVPAKRFSAVITPTVADQELITESSAGVTYWEGRSTVSADLSSTAITGNAYVELVGYANKNPN